MPFERLYEFFLYAYAASHLCPLTHSVPEPGMSHSLLCLANTCSFLRLGFPSSAHQIWGGFLDPFKLFYTLPVGNLRRSP